MSRGHEHISFVLSSAFREFFLKFSQNKIEMGKKILVLCLDVIMIAFFPRNIQSKTILLILNQKKGITLLNNRTQVNSEHLFQAFIARQKTFSLVLSINSSKKDKALPAKTSNRTSSPSSCISEIACLISCEISQFVTAANPEGILLATYASLASFARRNWR